MKITCLWEAPVVYPDDNNINGMNLQLAGI